MIRIENVKKAYSHGRKRRTRVLEGISLEIPDKGITAIFGKSGCGKTTLLNIVGGLEPPDEGGVFIDSQSLSEDTDRIRNRVIGYVFQNYCLEEEKSVYDNVADALKLCGIKDSSVIEERVIAALGIVGMERFRKRLPCELSGGQRQRVAIARAFVKSPSVILADEPTGNLDPKNTAVVMGLLKSYSQSRPVILVTHDENIVSEYCDRVIELSDGKAFFRQSESRNDGKKRGDVTGLDAKKGDKREKASYSVAGIDIEVFDTPPEKSKLRIIFKGGSIYIDGSEIPDIVLGPPQNEVFGRENSENDAPENPTAEMQRPQGGERNLLTQAGKAPPDAAEPIPDVLAKGLPEGRCGRLYDAGSALKNSFSDIFGKKKKGKRTAGAGGRNILLPVSVALLSAIVLMFASGASAGVREYIDVEKEYNKNVFYIPIGSDFDDSFIESGLESGDIDYAKIITNAECFDSGANFTLSLSFMTAQPVSVSVRADMVSADILDDTSLVCGRADISGDDEVVISTALADALLSDAALSFIQGREGLVGCALSFYPYRNMKIAGIAENDNRLVFMEDVRASYAAYLRSRSSTPDVMPSALCGKGLDLGDGQVIFYSGSASPGSVKKGDTVKIEGNEYTVALVIGDTEQSYLEYVVEVYSERLMSSEEYVEYALSEGLAQDEAQAFFMWFWEYYYRYYGEYMALSEFIREDTIYTWGVTELSDPAAAVEALAFSQEREELYAAYLYNAEYGVYPTSQDEAYRDILSEESYAEALAAFCGRYEKDYEAYTLEAENKESCFILSDGDFSALTRSFGESDEVTGSYAYAYTTEQGGRTVYSHYMMVFSNDAERAGQYLRRGYGDSTVSPDDMLSYKLAEKQQALLTKLSAAAGLLLLLLLCVYFTLRSQLMSLNRQIGVQLAIGASVKNLIFRFFIESSVFTASSVLTGYILGCIFVGFIGSAGGGELFYLPLTPAVLYGIFVCLLCILTGLLPPLRMLNGSAGRILAKYDM